MKKISKEYQEILKLNINGLWLVSEFGRFHHSQGYSFTPYIVDVTGLDSDDADKKVREHQEQNYFRISVGILEYLTLNEIETRIKAGWKTILEPQKQQAIENLIWVLENWKTENEGYNSQIKYERALKIIEALAKNNPKKDLSKDKQISTTEKEFTIGKELESVIADVRGILTKEGKFCIWNYSPEGFFIDLSGLSKKEMFEKVQTFQSENFIRFDANDIETIGLSEYYTILEAYLKYSPLQDKEKAISNFLYVLNCWKSQTHSFNDQVKYEGILDIVNRLKTEIGITSKHKIEASVGAKKHEMPKFEKEEKENHPEFYTLFLSGFRYKIPFLIQALINLDWITKEEKWNANYKFIAAITDYLFEQRLINGTTQKNRDKIFCERFGLKYVEIKRRGYQSSYQNPKIEFIEMIKEIMES